MLYLMFDHANFFVFECSQTEDVEVSESFSAIDKLDQDSPKNGHLTAKDVNNNCLTSHRKSHDSSDEPDFKRKSDRKADIEAQRSQKKEKGQKGTESISQNKFSEEKNESQEDKTDKVVIVKKKKISCDKESRGCDFPEDTQKSWCYSKDKIKNRSESERDKSEKESQKKLKTSQETTNKGKDSSAFNSNNKYSKTFPEADVSDNKNSEKCRDSEKNRKRKEKHASPKSENAEHKHKKLKRDDEESDSEKQFMSFESFLNYDVNVCKRKEKSAAKKAAKKIKAPVKEEESGDLDARMDGVESNPTSPKLV